MTFEQAKAWTGWTSDCARSPKPSTRAAASRAAEGDGWEPARERLARRGYEYGIAPGAHSAGFVGKAYARYFRLVRRPVAV